MSEYGELAAAFLAGDKAVAAELRKVESAQLEADALRRRREAADRFLAEQALAAERAQAEVARQAEAERVASLRADFGVAQHELDVLLAEAARQAAEVMRLSVAAFNDDGVYTVAAQILGAIFRCVDDPFRRRLLGELGGDYARARDMGATLGVSA